METINGISFEDWAAACAHLAQGMPESEVIATLDIEIPVWQDTNEQWSDKLADLMTQDMNVATQYGEIFANPKVGKFAGSNTTQSGKDILAIVPDWETYQKIHIQISEASNHGIDPVTVLEENGLDLGKWGAIGMEYINKGLSSIDDSKPDVHEKFQYYSGIIDKWKNHWKEHYKNHATDLSSDIDF